MASCDFIWQCVKSRVQYFTHMFSGQPPNSRPSTVALTASGLGLARLKAFRIEAGRRPQAQGRRHRSFVPTCPLNIPFHGVAGGFRVSQACAPHARLPEGKKNAGLLWRAGYRGIEIETVILGVACDNSRSTTGNFDDIGVGHVSFLLLA